MIDISKIKKGDRVRITRANGDEATFTVRFAGVGGLNSLGNTYERAHWDTIEVLTLPLPIEEGFYESSMYPALGGYGLYALGSDKQWRIVFPSGYAQKASDEDMDEVAGTLTRVGAAIDEKEEA